MKPAHRRRILVVVTWTFALSTATAALLLLRTARQVARETDALLEQSYVLNSKALELEKKISANEAERVALHETLNQLKAQGLQSAANPPSRRLSNETADPLDRARHEATLQNLYLSAQRAKVRGRYVPILKTLLLPADQQEKLEELIHRREELAMDLAEVVNTNHIDPADPAVQKLRVRAENDFARDALALLGEASYALFTEYERALPAWKLVNRFAGAMALAGQPLNETQAASLASTLANASPSYREGGKADLDTVDWNVAATESAAVLTPAQALSFLNSAPFYRVKLSSDDPLQPQLPLPPPPAPAVPPTS